MRRNYFETAVFLFDSFFKRDKKKASCKFFFEHVLTEGEATIRNSINFVKNQQDEVLNSIETLPEGQDFHNVISPAF